MKALAIGICCLMGLSAVAFSAAGSETVRAFGREWLVDNASDWAVEGNVLRLLVKAEPPAGGPRRPTKIALLSSKPFTQVTVDLEVKRNGRSVILVYGWQDSSHYNYAHISSDNAIKQNVHNGMFHIFGGERARISVLDGPASLESANWTPVKLIFDGDAGLCHVEVNGKRNPSLEAVDLSLRWGRVGLGSFNETGEFRNVRVAGDMREPGPVGQK